MANANWMRASAASRPSRGSIAPAGNAARTRCSIRARSDSRGDVVANASRSRSAVQKRSSVCITARTIPGSSLTLSISLKFPLSKASAIAGASRSLSAKRRKPPANRAASNGRLSISSPTVHARAASSRLMRKESGPSTTMTRRFM